MTLLAGLVGACNLASGNGLDPYATLDPDAQEPSPGGASSSGGTAQPGGSSTTADGGVATPVDARPGDPGQEPTRGAFYILEGALGGASFSYRCTELGSSTGDLEGFGPGVRLDSAACDPGATRYELRLSFPDANVVPPGAYDFTNLVLCDGVRLAVRVTTSTWTAEYGGLVKGFGGQGCTTDPDAGSSPVTYGSLLIQEPFVFDGTEWDASMQVSSAQLVRGEVSGIDSAAAPEELVIFGATMETKF